MSEDYQSNEFSKKIDAIIQKRNPLAEQIQIERSRLDLLSSHILNLENLFYNMGLEDRDIEKKLGSVNFQDLKNKIRERIQDFEKLKQRFSRTTINIGVVGLARQGKSTLLQSLSGLDDSIIPSGSSLPCTGVQSTIYHQAVEKTSATVYFYSESSFIKQVIKPYYEALDFQHIPTSLTEFRDSPFPKMTKQYPNPATANALFKRLHDDYYVHLKDYIQWLKTDPLIQPIPKEEIHKFVSQEYDGQGNPYSFAHLAVREVKISCPFPKVAVEKVGLVDMPGLGDTKLGDRERMIQALGEDADFILFVRRPGRDKDGGDVGWGQEDHDLWDSAYQALKDKLPLEKWSFMVLNCDGENVKMCSTLETMKSKESIGVNKFLKANCKDARDVNPDSVEILSANQVLGEVLTYLIDHIVGLDTLYVTSCCQGLRALQESVNAELSKARRIIQSGHSDYVDCRDKFLNTLFAELENLRNELLSVPEEPDRQFKARIDLAIKNCKQAPGIPSLEQIETYYKQNKSPGGTYDQCLHEIRANAVKYFHEIEGGLKESLDEKKTRVSKILGELGLNHVTGECDEIEFLRQLEAKIPVELSNLKRGFDFLWSFDLLYKGFIQSIVWQHLRRFLPPDGDPAAVAAMQYGQSLQKILSCLPSALDLTKVIENLAHSSDSSSEQQLFDSLPSEIDPTIVPSILAEPAIQEIFGQIQSGVEPATVAAILAGQIVQGLFKNLLPHLKRDSARFDAKVMQATLGERHKQAVEQCEKALSVLAKAPAEIGCSMIEEFIDHVHHAQGVRSEWDKFLGDDEVRLKVWPQLRKIEERRKMQEGWSKIVEEAESVNQSLSDMSFYNYPAQGV